jgi:threonine synthase
LVCRECGSIYPEKVAHVCEKCFGPLEVQYRLDEIKLTPEEISRRPRTIWRYREFLPVADQSSIVDLGTGLTPLHRCRNLGEALGLKNLYVKDDTTNPTNSFKDRPASVAISKARELGVTVVGCPSTGNLAASVAAHAAKAGLPCYVFIPANTEVNKVLQASVYGAKIVAVDGTYDEANRLAAEVAEEHGWAFANINLRPYYVEGSKTLAFEICEQLGWKNPDNVIIPLGSGALFCAMERGFSQLKEAGLTQGRLPRLIGAQGEGSDPIVRAFKKGSTGVPPIERPDTVAKSLAIGDPGDGKYVLRAMRASGGFAESVGDEEILDAIHLIAEKEGVFVEPAGGVTVGVLKKLAEEGKLDPEETTVCCVTGNGFKAADTILKTLQPLRPIPPTLEAFEERLEA